jgi:ribosomal protein L22
MADEKDITENPEPAAAAEAPAPEAEAKPKPKRAAKPKAEAAEAAAPEADAEAADEAKPKPKRAAKPKAEKAEPVEAAAPEVEEAPAEEKPKPKRATKPKAEPVAATAAVPSVRVVRAQAKYVRSSARKARLVCDHIRGKSVEEARAILAFTPRAVAKDWSKVLESAVANAEHNHELDGESLVIKAAHADEGPTLKRFRPRAMGRATPIRKRTSHLTILLAPKE